MTAVADANRRVFTDVVDTYLSRELEPNEFQLLARHRGEWPHLAMLDLGVGAGRTAFTFAAVAGRYVGLDYSAPMLDAARARLRGLAPVDLREGDARDLRAFPAASFDVVLFSANGIDAVEHDDRLRILDEVRRVLAPGGELLFNVHNLHAYPPDPCVRLGPPPTPLHAAWDRFRLVRLRARLESVLRETDLAAVRRRGFGALRDGAHDFRVRNFYIDPILQRAELEAAGFRTLAIHDMDGARVTDLAATRSPHLWFLATGA